MQKKWTCPGCGREISRGKNTCPVCGAKRGRGKTDVIAAILFVLILAAAVYFTIAR